MSQFIENNVPEVEFSLLFFSENANCLITSFPAALGYEDLMECLSPSGSLPIPHHCLLVSTPSCSPCLWCHLPGFHYCPVPSLLSDASVLTSAMHRCMQLDTPLVQNSSSHSLILVDPALEK